MDGQGRVEVRVGAAENGQGIVGVAAQIAAEELGVPYENITVVVGDTARTLDGGATTASRQTFITGNAVRLAAGRLREARAAAPGPAAPTSASCGLPAAGHRPGGRAGRQALCLRVCHPGGPGRGGSRKRRRWRCSASSPPTMWAGRSTPRR